MNNGDTLDGKPDDYYSAPRKEMLDFIPLSAQKALDVGCSEGLFGAALKERGMEIWGIEIDGRAAEIARRRFDKVLVGDVSTMLDLLPDRYFDCMIFNDTLEHFVDPYAVLLRAKEKLSKEGVVVCSFPNVRYYPHLKNLLIKKDWKYENAGILDRTHLRFFTGKSIRETFASLGYQIIRMEGINRLHPSWKFILLNFLARGHLSDTLFMQFAVVAKPDLKR